MAIEEKAKIEVRRDNNSFYFLDEEGISEYWRRNKSTVPALELAQLLTGVRKFTAHLGSNTGSIIWEGMKEGDSSCIVLDPEVVRGKYPIPAVKTDYVIGTATLGAYRLVEWSERAQKLTWEKAPWVEVDQRYLFQMFIDIAERIYLEQLIARSSVLDLYIEVARNKDLENSLRNFLPSPSVEELLHYWWISSVTQLQPSEVFALNHKQEDIPKISALYGDALSVLRAGAAVGFLQTMERESLTDRCQHRSDIYASIWVDLLGLVKGWQIDRFSEEGGTDQDQFSGAATGIPDSTLKAIENAMGEGFEFTEAMMKLTDGYEAVVKIKMNNMVLPMEEHFDKQLYLKLKSALRMRSRARSRISRGLKSGSIDKRRLYRAPVTGEVFQYKKPIFELENDVILLVDASSSMIGPKWKIAQRIFYSMFEALKDFNKRTRVFAYYEYGNVCYLSELSQKGKLYTVVPKGKTASGEAITAVAMLLENRRNRKKPLIIHLTDGASNWGSSVDIAIDYCRKQSIGLVTLGIGATAPTQTLLREEYGKQVCFVNDISFLPQLFSKLVNTTNL